MAADTFADELATVAGWGKDDDSSISVSPVCRTKADRRIMDNPECAAIYGTMTVNDGCICIDTSADNAGVCNGDSGGMLHLQRQDAGGWSSLVCNGGCGIGSGYSCT
jgi:hypothetical protein